ncbi:MAG: hypothetical protein OET90_07955 [Desulfuromonadales bacterium]|nr:hypothetical protein [Desulfuromonadales bacterium]
MDLQLDIALISLLFFALVCNIPLGYLRMRVPKFSLYWFIYIHLSVPFIIALRLANNIHWHVIPFSIFLAVSGQMIGSRLYRRKRS